MLAGMRTVVVSAVLAALVGVTGCGVDRARLLVGA
jgi:hypothetical protein